MDNAATSWPKPPAVIAAMERNLRENGANPGRGSHTMAVQAGRVLFDTRRRLARLFGIANPNDIAFTLNTTYALNLAIHGLLKSGDHVVATSIEHNSVRRPLETLRNRIGIEVTYVATDREGTLDMQAVREAIRPRTRLIAATHSSNLLGSIVPLGELGEIARRAGAVLLVDAAQSAGVLPIDVPAMGIGLLAFPGHKGLFGPQGTAGLYIDPNIDLEPLVQGGTGSKSESPDQPSVRPDRYEAGTQNTVGLAGLAEGAAFVLKETTAAIHKREQELTFRLMEDLLIRVPGIQLLGPPPGRERTAIVSFVVPGIDPSEMAFLLDQRFGIAVRSGFHCTPLGHGTAGTLETGAVRASPGYFTTESEIVSVVDAVAEIAQTLGRT